MPCHYLLRSGKAVPMTHDPTILAKKLIAYIQACPLPVSYEVIYKRATSKHAIPQGILDNALAIVHRSKLITRNSKGLYTVKIQPLPRPAPTHMSWLRNNYPWVKDFIMPFPEIDMSHIFLSPEDLLKYKAQVRGVAYIPTKRYARK